jgi:predicted deacylase
MNEDVRIGKESVPPGTRAHLEIPVARLFTGNWLALPVAVVNGRASGPRLWLSAAIHGDELNGLEIIRRVLGAIDPKKLRGSVIAVPVVNVFGFVEQDRYLPDRRDLNRSFPGSPNGSLAARLAHLFIEEVVRQCQYGLDFHTGSLHRENLPQIRANLKDPETRRLSEAFGAPFMYQAKPIPGSLRATAVRMGVRCMVYEGGEPLRFHDDAINCGVQGAIRVMNALGMWDVDEADRPGTFEATSTRWIRAGRSGILHLSTTLGQQVEKGQVLGHISIDFLTPQSRRVRAPNDGLVVAYTNNPLVNQGDALINLATA